jgi:hypothetical protein
VPNLAPFATLARSSRIPAAVLAAARVSPTADPTAAAATVRNLVGEAAWSRAAAREPVAREIELLNALVADKQKPEDNDNDGQRKAPQICGACDGSGKCVDCKGSGEKPKAAASKRTLCSVCNGSGKCAKYDGSGKRDEDDDDEDDDDDDEAALGPALAAQVRASGRDVKEFAKVARVVRGPRPLDYAAIIRRGRPKPRHS